MTVWFASGACNADHTMGATDHLAPGRGGGIAPGGDQRSVMKAPLGQQG